jgi:hypothetical protein
VANENIDTYSLVPSLILPLLLLLLLLLLVYDSQAILIVRSALRSEDTVCGTRNTQRNGS